MKIKLVLLLILFANFILAQNVIIVVIDGARYTETFGGGDAYIPHMYNDLRPVGYLYTNFRIADEGKTETNPGHASILTGTWQQIANDGTERPTEPTTFEYFRKELGSTLTENYVIAGKSKLNVISYGTDINYGFDYRATVSCADVSDNSIYTTLISLMATDHPRLIIVNLADTDRQGHTGVWSNYINALTNADNLVYQLWQHIQAGDYGYTLNNTTLFITNDHGRHDDAHGGFTNHGDDCEGCEHIMLLAIGRNVTQGVENFDLHYQIDLAPTIGDLLAFSTPQAVGTSLYNDISPLPVELIYFSAVVLDNGVKLNWRTETEVNNYGFEILRSAQNDIWEKIGFVEGSGNSNSPKEYSLIDKNVNGGKVAYRLKQIDTDGQFEYSNVIEVDLGSPQKFELSQNYPNPFNPSTTIRFTLPQAGNVKLMVYNLLGEEVAQLVNEFKEAGVHTINFNASEFNSGVYIYKLEVNGLVQTRKMTLLK